MKNFMITSQLGFALLLCQMHLAQASTLEALTSPAGAATLVPPNELHDDATAGYEFAVGAQPLRVSSLGVWDPTSIGFGGSGLGGGFSTSHEVGIWTAGGTLLASATVPAGTSAGEIGGYLYASIAPIILSAGTDYVIGFNVLGDRYHSSSSTPSDGPVFNTPDVTFVVRAVVATPVASPAGSLTFPANSPPGTGWDANFQFQPIVVPEPSSLMLVGISAVGLLAATRRRRRGV